MGSINRIDDSGDPYSSFFDEDKDQGLFCSEVHGYEEETDASGQLL